MGRQQQGSTQGRIKKGIHEHSGTASRSRLDMEEVGDSGEGGGRNTSTGRKKVA